MREWIKLYRDEPARFASLSLGARMLAAYMLKFADKDGRFPLGNRDPVTAIAVTIGADVGDRRTMRRTVQELITHGYLTVGAGTVDIVSWPKYQADVKRSPTEHEPSTNTTRTEHEHDTNRARTEHENRPKCAESNGGTERALIRVEEKREDVEERRSSSASFADSFTPNLQPVIDAYRDGIAEVAGRRVPVSHSSRMTQARTVRDAIDSTLPTGTEAERLALVRAAARAAWEDEEHRKAAVPFAWFAKNLGKYVSRLAAPKSSESGLAAERAKLLAVAQAEQAKLPYVPLLDGNAARARVEAAWAALRAFDRAHPDAKGAA